MTAAKLGENDPLIATKDGAFKVAMLLPNGAKLPLTYSKAGTDKVVIIFNVGANALTYFKFVNVNEVSTPKLG